MKILVLIAFTICATFAAAQPRPITEAEEQAVRFVAAHLQSGPSTLWDAASASSRFRKLGREEGGKEIELRVGPHAGSEWELVTTGKSIAETVAAFHVTFPSGVDDTVLFTMARDGGAWKIADIRSMSDVATAVAAGPAPAADRPAARPAKEVPVPLIATGSLALIFAIAMFATGKRRRVLTGVFAALTIVSGASFAALFYLRHQAAAASRVATASIVAISPAKARELLVGFRRSAASGEALSAGVTRGLDRNSADRAALWNAQLHLQRNDLAAAAKALAKVGRKNDTPLAQILAGRMAFLQNRDVDAVIAYERAMELGPEHDDLLYETASVLMTLGFHDRAERYFRRLAELGSREPEAWYSLAMLDVMADTEDAAEKHLLTAYRARPELRASIVRVGMFYGLLRRPLVRAQFAMHQSDEPLVTPSRLAERPLAIPPGAAARVLGEHLEIDFLGSKLHVPSGAFMAPAGTPVLDAGAWDRSEASRALTSAPALARVAAQPSTYAQPALARRVVETASALATHNRWEDVAALTSGLTVSFDLAPADLLLMKAEAHKRTGKTDSARALLHQIVVRPSLMKRLDARQLLDAAEMLASMKDNELAIRLMERAGQLRELPHIDDRIRQLTMNQRLATFSTHETPHFVIRYSEETGKFGAANIGTIAEAELERLKKRIPIANLKPVVINVLSWETFRGTYTGTDHILGFYDGQITVPFAQVGYWPPEIVAILSHELAHAMIAQRTNDQAPRWFQEGFAQRIESVQYKANPFNMYDADQLLAFCLVDDVVTFSPDPAVVGQGYLMSHALIRYIEARYGQAGLVRLLDAFASGATTEEAVERLSGSSLAAFDKAFVDWGRSRREVFENADLVSYEGNDIEITMRKRKK